MVRCENYMNISKNTEMAVKFGAHEVELCAKSEFGNPYFDVNFKVEFQRPNGTSVAVGGFYDGGNTFKARAYCDMVGTWKWNSVSNHDDLNGHSGTFEVIPSKLKGKLRIHNDDPWQFAYDNGEWFLHIGDTGYRCLIDTEVYWKEYIDQAVSSGITKIRAWFCQDRGNVQALFQHDREYLNLSFWQEIEKRLIYTLNNYPDVIIQLILYGEDQDEVKRAGSNDAISLLVAKYAQARFSSFPNIHWCISNDFRITEIMDHAVERKGQEDANKKETIKGIKDIGNILKQNEPWGTLITNHQARFSGYMFSNEEWSDIVTLEDMGQVTGQKILEYRSKVKQPVVIDEDRYECWRGPKHKRYFFRRLMWASILSGGHATYGGLLTYEQFDGGIRGMYGYYNACLEGKLKEGAHDFYYIHKFFSDTGLTMINMVPDDNIVYNQPLLYKAACNKDKDVYIIYLANPDVYLNHAPDGFNGYYTDEIANKSENATEVVFELFDGVYMGKWYNPSTGLWVEQELNLNAGKNRLISPDKGDWVLLLKRLEP